PRYNVAGNFSAWATPQYQQYGYADLMDQMLIGAYAGPGSVTGTTEWTMQGFCSLAKQRTMGDCPMVAGGPDVGNWDTADKFTQEQENRAITQSVPACYNACDGYFLFDMIHLKKADQWQYVKAGIDGVLPKK
ncbi:MAG: S-layer protein, partial [Alistipes sp.]|nr:S-layer protein [Alistipes sp.]